MTPRGKECMNCVCLCHIFNLADDPLIDSVIDDRDFRHHQSIHRIFDESVES